MPTFDIVSKLDMQKVDNAINVAHRKITQRYDFKGLHVVLELDKKAKTLKVEGPDNMKVQAMQEMIRGSLHDQGLSPKVIDWSDKEDASMGAIRYNCKLREGIDKDLAKKIVKKIKDTKMKVKASIQGEQVRVEAKSIDDLQSVIALMKSAEDIETPLQFENMKR